MISNRRVGAGAAVRLVLLTVLLGLFGMHALTAHGGDHHGGAVPMAVHAGAGHHAPPSAMADAAPAGAVLDHLADPGPAGLAPDFGHVPALSPGAPGDTAGLVLCWLLLTAGMALLTLLLCGLRLAASRARRPVASTVAGPGRPRAPPGRVRLLELAILRV